MPIKDSNDEGHRDPSKETNDSNVLVGTSLKVYRLLYRVGKPLGVREVQRGANLSSSSVALYHIRKLLQAGLIREEAGGYVVDRVVFENMIRIRRSLIPLQVAFAVFYVVMLAALIILFRPNNFLTAPLFLFSLVVTASAIGIFVYGAFASRKSV